MLVMKAGSNPFLLEKSSPEKMLTLTCLPKKKTTTCIKYSVCIAGSGTQLMITTTVNKPMKSVWSCCLLMLCFFSSFVAVHNVKPECLDAYNELWYESLLCYLNSDVTLEHFFGTSMSDILHFHTFSFLFVCVFSEDVLSSIHTDPEYPCELVGTWNTWYGEQDQAGKNIHPTWVTTDFLLNVSEVNYLSPFNLVICQSSTFSFRRGNMRLKARRQHITTR